MNERLETIDAQLHRWRSDGVGLHQPVNSYLVLEGDATILIDPAHDLSPDAIAARGLPPVQHILVTHVQREHVAGCARFPGVPVHVPRGDEYLCRGPAAYAAHLTPWPGPWSWEERGNYQGQLAGAANERPSDASLNLAEPLVPGQRAWGFDVIATPGHGKHAVTLRKRIGERNVAFCGDLIHGDGQLWNWFDADWDYGPQTGQRTLRASVDALMQSRIDVLAPSHGPLVTTPAEALERLAHRLDRVLAPLQRELEPDRAPERITGPQVVPGWTQVLPSLHQWQDKPGNCNVLISRTGGALVVDDGLCTWLPLPERREHHQRVFDQLKRELGIERIEMIIPTHYHGDHIEQIPLLLEREPARLIALDVVAEPIEHPDRFNLACPLPWYGTGYDALRVDQKVRDGERIRWHEYELDFFHLGGQTYYHAGIAVRVDGQQVVFAGDAVNGPEAACLSVLCYNDAEPATRGWAYAMNRLSERPADLLIAGHAVALTRPQAMIEATRALWRQRLEEFEALNPHPEPRRFFDPFLDDAPAGGTPTAKT